MGWGRETQKKGLRSEAGKVVVRGGPFKAVKIEIGPQKDKMSAMQIASLCSLFHKSVKTTNFSIKIEKQNLEQVLGYNTLFPSL